MRELKRSIARNLIKQNGIEKVNKKKPSQGNKSFFALHWRDLFAFASEGRVAK